MRILLLNWRDLKNEWGGGAEVYVTELAKDWVKSGHEVTFFCGQNYNKSLPEEEVTDGIKFVRKGGKYSLYLWAAWYYLTKFRRNCDVIVEAQNGVPFFTRLYSRKPLIPIYFHVHGLQFFIELPFPMNYIGYTMERFFFPLVYSRSPIVAISETTKNDLTKLGLNRKNISVVYCGLNMNPVRNIIKSKTPTILYLGKIKKYKRVSMLIKFMVEILKKVPNAKLIIAGWGTDGPFLTDISMKSVIKKHVNILGPVTEQEKKQLMVKSWVAVNPSMHEGWGIPVIEGNLFGTPTVSFRVPGLSESIKDGRTGILADSEQDFIDGVIKIVTNTKLRDSLSKESIKWAKSFSWEKSANKFINIIKDEVSKNKKYSFDIERIYLISFIFSLKNFVFKKINKLDEK